MIYYVEDDNSIREIVLYTLHSMGFEAQGFADGQSFLKALEEDKPSLIMLDVMLPDIDGIELLKILKRQARTSDLPVIMATARDAEIEKIQALDLGADDYLSKPFSMMEMVARVKAVLRRYKKEETKLITAGNLSIDENSHVVKENARVVELTFKEYELLSFEEKKVVLFDILCNLFCILTCCVDVVSSALKLPVSVFVFQIGVPLKYDQTTLSLEKTYETGYTHLRRYLYQHMNMVGAYLCLYYFHLFPVA